MPVPNQIDHRELFRRQTAAGTLPDYTAGRHGTGRLAPIVPLRLPQRPDLRRPQKPTAPAPVKLPPPAGLDFDEEAERVAEERRFVAEQRKREEEVMCRLKQPPAVHIDPPVAEGELPPVAEITEKPHEDSVLPPMPQHWTEQTSDEQERETPLL